MWVKNLDDIGNIIFLYYFFKVLFFEIWFVDFGIKCEEDNLERDVEEGFGLWFFNKDVIVFMIIKKFFCCL